jgi:hypothetical protein
MARVGEEFPLECPACGGDIRLIAFITEPGPIRKILTHLLSREYWRHVDPLASARGFRDSAHERVFQSPIGEPLEQPPISPARGPPTDWGELVQVHFRPRRLSGVTRRAARNRHPQPLTAAASQVTTKPRGRRTRRGSAPTREKRHSRGGRQADRERPGAHPGDRSTRLASRSSAGRCSRKCHWPGYPFLGVVTVSQAACRTLVRWFNAGGLLVAAMLVQPKRAAADRGPGARGRLRPLITLVKECLPSPRGDRLADGKQATRYPSSPRSVYF